MLFLSIRERLQELKPSVGVYFPVKKHHFCSISNCWVYRSSHNKAKMVCHLEKSEFKDLSSLLLCFVTFNSLHNYLVFPR